MVARIVSSRTDAEVALADTYGAAKARLPGSEAVRHLRDEAFGSFAAAGLPHRRVEAWHYTDLRSFMRDTMRIVPASEVEAVDRRWLAQARAAQAVPRQLEQSERNEGLAEWVA